MQKKPTTAGTQRTRDGRFAKRSSGNPAGRPKGSRNQTSLMAEQLLAEEAEEIVGVLADLAEGGDPFALSLCLPRILPPAGEQPVQLDLSPPKNWKEAQETHAGLLTAVGEGRITPAQADDIWSMIQLSMELDAQEEKRPVSVKIETIEGTWVNDEGETILLEEAQRRRRLRLEQEEEERKAA